MITVNWRGTHTIRGVFLIGKEELNRLDEVIAKASSEIHQFVKEELQKELDKRTKDMEGSPTTVIERMREFVAAEYRYTLRPTVVTLKRQDLSTIEAGSCQELLLNPDVHSVDPYEIEVDGGAAMVRFGVSMFDSNNCITVSVVPKESPLTNRIAGMLDDWAESTDKYSHFYHFTSGPTSALITSLLGALVVAWCVFFPILGVVWDNGGYSALKVRARELNKQGIEDSNIREAVAVLMRLEADDYRGIAFQGVRLAYLLAGVVIVCGIVLQYWAPRSIVGVGKAAARLRKYKSVGEWQKPILGVIGAGIGALILAILQKQIFALLGFRGD
jgi:hypothetical protein